MTCEDCGHGDWISLLWRRAKDGRHFLVADCERCGTRHVVRRIAVADLTSAAVVKAIREAPVPPAAVL